MFTTKNAYTHGQMWMGGACAAHRTLPVDTLHPPTAARKQTDWKMRLKISVMCQAKTNGEKKRPNRKGGSPSFWWYIRYTTVWCSDLFVCLYCCCQGSRAMSHFGSSLWEESIHELEATCSVGGAGSSRSRAAPARTVRRSTRVQSRCRACCSRSVWKSGTPLVTTQCTCIIVQRAHRTRPPIVHRCRLIHSMWRCWDRRR